MPAQEDLQRHAAAIPNPFEDQATRVNEYTAQAVATLQSTLDRQLGPEYISTRAGAGGAKVHYLAAEKVINLANEVLGFNGWSSEVRNVHIDYVDEREGKVSMNCSVIVRVTLKDGTFHEDIGCGSMENSRSKAAAFEKVKKEAVTDALKRALRNFGNVLGNCLYDKDYLSKVSKLRVVPAKWDEDNLHRHPNYGPIRREAVSDTSSGEKTGPLRRPSDTTSARADDAADYEEYDGLFSEGDFDHPDEVRLDDSSQPEAESQLVEPKPAITPAQSRRPIGRVQTLSASQQTNGAGPPNLDQQPPKPPTYQRPSQHPVMGNQAGQRPGQPQTGRLMPPAGAHPHDATHRIQGNVAAATSGGHSSGPGEGVINPPVAFITGRAAEVLTKSDTPTANLPQNSVFNPHAQSPSIRRTTGIDHTTSHKVSQVDVQKAKVQVPPISNCHGPSPGAHSTNFVNPQADPSRRIGMPPAAGQSPLANRGLYRPPGPAPAGMKRPALADVSNVSPVGQAQVEGAGDGSEAKRVKVGP